MTEIAEEDVKGDGRTGMAEMWVAVYRGAAYVHADSTWDEGLKYFLVSSESIVDE